MFFEDGWDWAEFLKKHPPPTPTRPQKTPTSNTQNHLQVGQFRDTKLIPVQPAEQSGQKFKKMRHKRSSVAVMSGGTGRSFGGRCQSPLALKARAAARALIPLGALDASRKNGIVRSACASLSNSDSPPPSAFAILIIARVISEPTCVRVST